MRGLERLIGLLIIPLALTLYLIGIYNFMKERKDAAWKRAAGAWLEAKTAMDAAKDKILALGAEESCYGAGVKFLRNFKAGNVEYAKIPQLGGVNLEEYRRPGHFESRVSAI